MNTETVKISNCSENEETCDAGKIGVFFGIVEALLYVSGEPVSITELQRVFDISAPEIRKSISQMAEEMKYFNRSDYIKNAIMKQFPDTSEGLCDTISDKYIDSIFNM